MWLVSKVYEDGECYRHLSPDRAFENYSRAVAYVGVVGVLCKDENSAECQCRGKTDSYVITSLQFVAEPEKKEDPDEITRRDKRRRGECQQIGCSAKADVDGWCDEHSEQFKRFGTHHPVGPTGATGPHGTPGLSDVEDTAP